MKKVLLATTALAMTAGAAAADVALSGYAEIGIKDNGSEIVFHHDYDIRFTLSGETDGGLTFGATIDLDEVSNGISSEDGPHAVFVSGAFGTITMGDTDGAFDWAMTEIAWGTAIADDHSTHAGWNGNAGLDGDLDGQVARYDYAFGDFAVAVSAEIGGNTAAEDEILGIGAKYSTDFGGTTLGFGIGYQSGEYEVPTIAGLPAAITGLTSTADIYGVSLSADFTGGFSVRVNYSHLDGNIDSTTTTTTFTLLPGLVSTTSTTSPANIDFDWDHWGIGAAYTMDALTVEANYGEFSGNIVGIGDFSADGFGVAVNYDLGGGAVAMFGYGSGTGFATAGTNLDSTETWSMGLGLSF